jgi:hypothetical protein
VRRAAARFAGFPHVCWRLEVEIPERAFTLAGFVVLVLAR